jgi:YVTN family beta-propeller protein
MNANPNKKSILIASTRSAVRNVFLFFALSVGLLASVARGQNAAVPDTLPVNTVVATVKVGRIPQGVVVSPDSTTAYVANGLDNTVSVISAKTLTIEQTLFAGSEPRELAITSDGTKLYASNQVSPGTVTLIDLANGGATQTITGLSPFPLGVALSPDGKQLWVADGGIDVIDTTSNQVVTHISVPGGASFVTFTPDGLKAYACTFSGSKVVSVIDTTSDRVTTTITVGFHLGAVAIRGKTAYLTQRNVHAGMEVVAIDTATDKVIKTIKVGASIIPGNRPDFLPGKPYLYVPESTPGAVTLINTAKNTLVGGSFTCSSGSYDVAIAPNGAQVYVTDEFANTATIATIK